MSYIVQWFVHLVLVKILFYIETSTDIERDGILRKKALMIFGTASNVGKSTIALGLLRILFRKGRVTAPFKALNITEIMFDASDGRMSRGQALQCEAAGISPTCAANPAVMSMAGGTYELYLNGKRADITNRAAYYARKQQIGQTVADTYARYQKDFDAVILEGAGSPVELNLNKDDFVNQGMARAADANILIVGDIRQGGLFASMYGTVKLLDEDIRARVGGLIVNQFMGDAAAFSDGVSILKDITGIPVLGAVPRGVFDIAPEDSLSDPATNHTNEYAYRQGQYDALADHIEKYLDIAAIESLLPEAPGIGR